MSDKLKQSFEIVANQIDLVNQRIDGLPSGGGSPTGDETFNLYHRFEPFTLDPGDNYSFDFKKFVVPAGYRFNVFHLLSFSSFGDSFLTDILVIEFDGVLRSIHNDQKKGFTEKNINYFIDNNTTENREVGIRVRDTNYDSENERHETEKFVKISCAITKIE